MKGPEALARFLVNTLHGVRVLARAGVDRAALDDSVRVAPEVLQAPQKSPGRRGPPRAADRWDAAFILCSMAGDPIVVVGGLASWPGRYGGLAEILRELSGSEVYTAPLTPLDWLLGRIRGYGQLVFEVASVVDRALLESDSDKAVLVGHSLGGIACRLCLGGVPPFGGRRYSGHRRVRRLITLGTPHVATGTGNLTLMNKVNELFPDALHEAAGLGYLSVAGAAADGAASGGARRRYERFVEDGRVVGDGVVPVDSALLPGSETLVLEGVYHNGSYGRWYGSDKETVERWWPEDLRASADLVDERRR